MLSRFPLQEIENIWNCRCCHEHKKDKEEYMNGMAVAQLGETVIHFTSSHFICLWRSLISSQLEIRLWSRSHFFSSSCRFKSYRLWELLYSGGYSTPSRMCVTFFKWKHSSAEQGTKKRTKIASFISFSLGCLFRKVRTKKEREKNNHTE